MKVKVWCSSQIGNVFYPGKNSSVIDYGIEYTRSNFCFAKILFETKRKLAIRLHDYHLSETC